jgi:hypothetical protein
VLIVVINSSIISTCVTSIASWLHVPLHARTWDSSQTRVLTTHFESNTDILFLCTYANRQLHMLCRLQNKQVQAVFERPLTLLANILRPAASAPYTELDLCLVCCCFRDALGSAAAPLGDEFKRRRSRIRCSRMVSRLEALLALKQATSPLPTIVDVMVRAPRMQPSYRAGPCMLTCCWIHWETAGQTC